MTKLRLSIALHDYDRVQALFDGRVSIEGCDPVLLPMKAEEAFSRALTGGQFDVTEMSLSSYLVELSQGRNRYIAIPVFLSRAFRHGSIYIRTDRGIEQPADLAGKLVGVPEFQMTAALWARGLLQDSYGVPFTAIKWRTGGLENPGRTEKLALNLGPAVDIAPIGSDQTLSQLLADGTLDAVISAREPSAHGSSPLVARLFPDSRAAEEAYFRATGIFPIMHVVAIKRSLVEQYPWLPRSLFKAFTTAKTLAAADLTDVGALQVMLPWLHHDLDRVRQVMGQDYWPYGIESNRAALETAARYSHEQGLSDRLITVGEMFAAGSDDSVKI